MEPKDLVGLTPEDCAVIVYNYQMEEIDKVLKENERRIIPYLDQPAEIPEIDAKRLFQALEEMVNRAFISRPDITEGGTIEQWQQRAKDTLLRDLYQYAIENNSEDLLQQLGEIDPRYAPLPALTKEQEKELATLQTELNQLQDDISQKLEETLYRMRQITVREGEILNGTEKRTARRMLNQTENFLRGLSEFLVLWRTTALKTKGQEVKVKAFL